MFVLFCKSDLNLSFDFLNVKPSFVYPNSAKVPKNPKQRRKDHFILTTRLLNLVQMSVDSSTELPFLHGIHWLDARMDDRLDQNSQKWMNMAFLSLDIVQTFQPLKLMQCFHS